MFHIFLNSKNLNFIPEKCSGMRTHPDSFLIFLRKLFNIIDFGFREHVRNEISDKYTKGNFLIRYIL